VKLRVASQALKNDQQIGLLVAGRTGRSPACPIEARSLKLPGSIKLADPSFATPGKIDMLIGNEFFFKLLLSKRIQLDSGPILQETLFEWLIGGKIGERKPIEVQSYHQGLEVYCFLPFELPRPLRLLENFVLSFRFRLPLL
jgi:Putative peptidase (DUF1758)